MAEYSNTQRLQAIAIVDEMVRRGMGGGGEGGGNVGDAPLITESPLITAPSSTPARSMSGYNKLTYQVDVANIGTNVVVRCEGNLTGNNYVNLNLIAQNQDTTITANGSYLFTFDGKLTNTRLTVVSISGGSPSVTAHLLRGN